MSEAPIVSDSTAVSSQVSSRSFCCAEERGFTDATWIHVTGEVDLCSAQELKQAVLDAQRRVRLVVVDLRELTFMDSSGVHVLLDATEAARQTEGALMLVRGPAHVDQVLTLSGARERLEIIDLLPGELSGRAVRGAMRDIKQDAA
jgi:anti-anti-sigma factor